jgi:hypothetical protein
MPRSSALDTICCIRQRCFVNATLRRELRKAALATVTHNLLASMPAWSLIWERLGQPLGNQFIVLAEVVHLHASPFFRSCF